MVNTSWNSFIGKTRSRKDELLGEVIKSDELNLFKWLSEKIDEEIFYDLIYGKIASNGSITILEWALEQKIIDLIPSLSSSAALNGQLYCLKLLRSKECPWDEITCKHAAGMGHLDCLKWAHENGCPWNAETPCCAAINGHLDCLKYAHENDCQWNSWTCTGAALNNSADCLKYARDNDCPWDIPN